MRCGWAKRTSSPIAGPGRVHAPVPPTIKGPNRPTCSVRSAPNAEPAPPLCCRPATPKLCRFTSMRSQPKSLRALTLFSSSIKPAGMAPRPSRFQTTSRSCGSRHAHPNSTAKKISGNSCGRTGCRTEFSNPSTTSSITAATPGTPSSISRGKSCPSPAAIGQPQVTQSEDWYKASDQIVHAQAGLLAQRLERVVPERIGQILGRDLLIRAGADPGLGDAAMSGVLQFFYDVAEAAAQHASGRRPAEQTAQSSGEEVIQAATTGLGAGGCAAWLAAEQPAEDIAEPTVRTAGGHGAAAWRQSARLTHAPRRDCLTTPALERLVGEEPQQRHHDRRHTAAATAAAGLALAARAIHHASENIRQSHLCLLVLMSDAAPSDLASGPRPAARLWTAGVARVANDAMNHEPVPDEQHDKRADCRGDETGALIEPVPADALTDEGGDEGASDSQRGGKDEAFRLVRTWRKHARNQAGNEADYDHPDDVPHDDLPQLRVDDQSLIRRRALKAGRR